MIYLAGSLRNPSIPQLAVDLHKATKKPVFSDWFAAGPEADDKWKEYYKFMAPESLSEAEKYQWALRMPASRNVFDFDTRWIRQASTMVLALPAGKSGHLELGWFLGQGKPGFILLDDEDVRWDVMYQYATAVCTNFDNLCDEINAYRAR